MQLHTFCNYEDARNVVKLIFDQQNQLLPEVDSLKEASQLSKLVRIHFVEVKNKHNEDALTTELTRVFVFCVQPSSYMLANMRRGRTYIGQ